MQEEKEGLSWKMTLATLASAFVAVFAAGLAVSFTADSGNEWADWLGPWSWLAVVFFVILTAFLASRRH